MRCGYRNHPELGVKVWKEKQDITTSADSVDNDPIRHIPMLCLASFNQGEAAMDDSRWLQERKISSLHRFLAMKWGRIKFSRDTGNGFEDRTSEAMQEEASRLEKIRRLLGLR